MTDEELKNTIAGMLKDDRAGASAFHDAVRKLRAIATALEASLAPDVIDVRVEAGHRVNLGQQYSLVVCVPKAGLRDVLLRAYVPTEGFPVTLDLFDDEHPKCASLDELEATILHFLSHADVKQRLLEVKDVAA
ncbi:MAG: hypothetical protein U0441_33450 [Polyangiaceae bacterium]